MRRSFTLIEMMIALALIMALVLILLPATNRIMSSTTAASDRNHRLAQIALLSDVLDRAMLTSVAQDASGRLGFVGNTTSLQVSSAGVSMLPRSEGQPDDIQSIVVAFEGDAITLRQDRGSRKRLLDGVKSCRIEYSTGDGWTEDFDGASGLPRAVAVSVWFAPDQFDEPDDVPALSNEIAAIEEIDSERDPDWRRVFAVFDPSVGGEASE
ncbi:MAG: prepilin-type N-terminal cleavage/methylation domain-containing protein [Phycisphaera sp.]|nr:prepilin-type N-terminal cleavage/methylation domain-containing protein [Phycisphaera sp.]